MQEKRILTFRIGLEPIFFCHLPDRFYDDQYAVLTARGKLRTLTKSDQSPFSSAQKTSPS